MHPEKLSISFTAFVLNYKLVVDWLFNTLLSISDGRLGSSRNYLLSGIIIYFTINN